MELEKFFHMHVLGLSLSHTHIYKHNKQINFKVHVFLLTGIFLAIQYIYNTLLHEILHSMSVELIF